MKNEKICYQPDGTLETAKLICERLEWGDCGEFLDHADGYYFNNPIGEAWRKELPEGYTLGTLDKPDTKVYIRGVEGRGAEVIALLESLGGEEVLGLEGGDKEMLYYNDIHLGYVRDIHSTRGVGAHFLKSTHTEILLPEPEPEPKVIEFTLNTKDDCIMRDENDEIWGFNIFSHYERGAKCPFVGVAGGWGQCLPYNDETRKLIGKTIAPTEVYKFVSPEIKP